MFAQYLHLSERDRWEAGRHVLRLKLDKVDSVLLVRVAGTAGYGVLLVNILRPPNNLGSDK
jgi:hypothetical protein